MNYFSFQSLDCGRTWWMLCQNSFVLTQLDDLRMYYQSMTCYIFNWSLNLYAHIFQRLSKIYYWLNIFKKIDQLGIECCSLYMIHYFILSTWMINISSYIYLLSFLRFQCSKIKKQCFTSDIIQYCPIKLAYWSGYARPGKWAIIYLYILNCI